VEPPLTFVAISRAELGEEVRGEVAVVWSFDL